MESKKPLAASGNMTALRINRTTGTSVDGGMTVTPMLRIGSNALGELASLSPTFPEFGVTPNRNPPYHHQPDTTTPFGSCGTNNTNSSTDNPSATANIALVSTMRPSSPEVDSRDPPVAEPLHCASSISSSDLNSVTRTNASPAKSKFDGMTPAASSDATAPTRKRATSTLSITSTATTSTAAATTTTPTANKRPRLTLSAYHRPEQTVRLTDSNPSRKISDDFDLRAPGCRILGHGAFSTVRLAVRRSDGMKVAVKSIAKHEALRARRLRSGSSRHLDEWQILKQMDNNPFIVDLIDVFETDQEIHIVTEYCRGGELFAAIQRKGAQRSSFHRGRYSEQQAARITRQVLRALASLHADNIVHRDVKAENILLMSNDDNDIQVKLCDFGMARLDACAAAPTAGRDGGLSPPTPGLTYGTNSPPETSLGSASSSGPAIDVYCLGVTLYILLCGFSPVFLDEKVVFPDAYWGDISDEAKSIIRRMLHPEPSQRITAAEAICDPWIRNETVRVRRGSIAANLELVRSRLFQSLAGVAESSPSKRRRNSLCLSPKKRRASLNHHKITMNDLFHRQDHAPPMPSSLSLSQPRKESPTNDASTGLQLSLPPPTMLGNDVAPTNSARPLNIACSS